MKKISIIYGSTTGNTETVAELVKDNVNGEVTISNVTDANESMLKDADVIVFGSSTWGYGDLQDDFDSYIDTLDESLIGGKEVAIFGCGDSISFSDVFCQATETIQEKVLELKGKVTLDLLKVDGEPSDSKDEIVEFAKSI